MDEGGGLIEKRSVGGRMVSVRYSMKQRVERGEGRKSAMQVIAAYVDMLFIGDG